MTVPPFDVPFPVALAVIAFAMVMWLTIAVVYVWHLADDE